MDATKVFRFFFLIFDILVLLDEYFVIECNFRITLFAFFPHKILSRTLENFLLSLSFFFFSFSITYFVIKLYFVVPYSIKV